MNWRVVNSGLADAVTNMAIDEAILSAHGSGQVPPTLRLYGWQPAAISLGYFQRTAAEIDVAECKSRGIGVVRRLTGGRAVLHDQELTYSIVVREDCHLIPPTITASYRYFCGGLLAGLRQLGVDAQMSMPGAAYGQRKKKQASAACFDAPSHYEITVNERKLIGSAQVRKNGVVLQHGSVLLQFCPEEFVALLRLSSPEVRENMVELLRHRATSLAEILGRTPKWQEVCTAMVSSFGPALGIELEAGELTDQEQATSSALAASKYSQDSWNMLR
ncbi:MAG TPA: lipoate--protein ligase family protein [Negativicutes bacterium]|jgi:lipoate-protein ligase A